MAISRTITNSDGSLTMIAANGSLFGFEQVESIQDLLDVLGRERLQSRFAPFYEATKGGMTFRGNFVGFSHAFDIFTNNAELIDTLVSAIKKNVVEIAYP